MNIIRIFLSLCQSPLFNQHDVFTPSTPINITLTVILTTSNSYFITTFIILIFILIKQPVSAYTSLLFYHLHIYFSKLTHHSVNRKTKHKLSSLMLIKSYNVYLYVLQCMLSITLSSNIMFERSILVSSNSQTQDV